MIIKINYINDEDELYDLWPETEGIEEYTENKIMEDINCDVC